MHTVILYEDNEILVCYKPAGLPTQTNKIGQQDIVSELKNYLANQQTGIKNQPYIGLIHRLDQPVEGLLVFGKTQAASNALSRQITENTIKKQYYAVVLGEPDESSAKLADYIKKETKTNTSHITQKNDTKEKKAELIYNKLCTIKLINTEIKISLLDITLLTGRHHQIRVQMSHAGYPLLGDGKYGTECSNRISRKQNINTVALCAYSIELIHPKNKKQMSFEYIPKGKVFEEFGKIICKK